MPTIVEEGLADEAFIRERAENYAALKELVARYTPEKVALVTRIAAETIRDDARLYATSDRSMIFWGMGISQHIHGTDNARSLISLALLPDRSAGRAPARIRCAAKTTYSGHPMSGSFRCRSGITHASIIRPRASVLRRSGGHRSIPIRGSPPPK
jgi:hypothetical protein